MSERKKLRDANAGAGLALSKAIGDSFEFSHAGGPTFVIWGMPEDEEISIVEEGGINTQIKTRLWIVPLQAGFPATETQLSPVQPGDVLEHEGKTFYVMENGVKRTNEDGEYEVRVVERRRKASGVRG